MPLATRSLIHPKRLTSLSNVGWFPSLCTIQTNTPTRSPSGASVPGWANTSMVAVPCRVMPLTATENRLPQYVSADTTHEIELAGVYAAIVPEQQAIVTGNSAGVYDITGAETDGNASLTRLYARIQRTP